MVTFAGMGRAYARRESVSHPAGTIPGMTIPPASPHSDQPEQLALLDASQVPLQFRLDAQTRRRGLVHVAELRRTLAEQAARTGHERTRPGSLGPVAA